MRARTRRRVRRGGAACRTYPPLPPCACRCITGSLYCRLIVLPAPCIAGSVYCRLRIWPFLCCGLRCCPFLCCPFLCCPFCCGPFLRCLFLCPCCMPCGPPPGSPLCRLCRCKLCLCGMPCGLHPDSPAVHPLCPLSCPPPLLPGNVAVGCCRPVGCVHVRRHPPFFDTRLSCQSCFSPIVLLDPFILARLFSRLAKRAHEAD